MIVIVFLYDNALFVRKLESIIMNTSENECLFLSNANMAFVI